MKKFIPIVIVSILVLSGLGAAAFNTNVSTKNTMTTETHSVSVQFSSQPVLQEKDGFVTIDIEGATTELIAQNKPVLPIYVKTYQIPFGSQNIQVVCSPQDISTMKLNLQVIPAQVAPLSKMSERTDYVLDASVYTSAELYPSSWYRYELGAGRNEDNLQVTFVKVICYPVRYSPVNNLVTYTNGFEISMTYDAPTPKTTSGDEYDMVIIAPAAFEAILQPLIDHKTDKGVATMFKSMEDILVEYTGYDQPEQVKYFIKDMYDTYDITYALLVGGIKSHIYAMDKDTKSAGYTDWHVPVRYVSIPEEDDEGCLCDLYYGCLYNGTGAFDSWDSNGDGVYAAWGSPGSINDKFDMNPEVYVSRLPVAKAWELKNLVKKIIDYESTGPEDKDWYKNMVGIGGKTFDYYAGKPDGEYLCDLAIDYMTNLIPDLNPIRVYSTNRDISIYVPDKTGISKGISQGAGFVDFEGHGSPARWDTIWFDGSYEEHDWVGGIGIENFWKIQSGKKYPVIVVGGCHNGMYNISLIPAMKDKTGASYFAYGYPVFICFSWGLVVKPFGGAIASTGCTGYGMGYQGNPVSLSGELESNFFWQIGMNGATNLAEAHSKAIQKFIAEEDINQIEAFVITNWALFGDPSLLFGGYSA
ncbi:MAG: hypothetical protein JXA00_04255 [Candidatus Thermoplasmatota archaeon]|nr:hypothetical protein [Candidatus Thermoplasmatota archaeon]